MSGAAGFRVPQAGVESWTTEQVCEWAESMRLPAVVPVFTEEEIDGEVLLLLEMEDMRALGLKYGVCKKLSKYLRRLRGDDVSVSASENTSESSLSPNMLAGGTPGSSPVKGPSSDSRGGSVESGTWAYATQSSPGLAPRTSSVSSSVGSWATFSSRGSSEPSPLLLPESNTRPMASYRDRLSTLQPGMVTITEKAIIMSVDGHLCKFLGYSQEELVGENVRILMPSPYHDRHDHYIDRYLKTGQKQIIGNPRRVEVLTKSGEAVPVMLCVSEVRSAAGRSWIGVLHPGAPDTALITCDTESNIVSASGLAVLQFGARNVASGQPISNIISNPLPMERYAGVSTAAYGIGVNGSFPATITCEKGDGGLYHMRVQTVKSIECRFTIDRSGRILLCNPVSTYEVFGWAERALKGAPLSHLVPGFTKTTLFKRFLQESRAEGSSEEHAVATVLSSASAIHKDGGYFPVSVRVEGSLRRSTLSVVVVRDKGPGSQSNGDDTSVVGDYALSHTRLGSGTFSDVFAGTDQRDGSLVAVKVTRVRKAAFDGVEHQEYIRALREAEILRRLDHPNICKMLDCIEEDNCLYSILELVDGGTLFDLCRKRRLPEAEARNLFLPILQAVRYLHGLGVAHRDLKDTNIMLDKFGNPKLIDFGTAYAAAPANMTGQVPLTPSQSSSPPTSRVASVAHAESPSDPLSSLNIHEIEPNDGLRATFCGTREFAAPEILLQLKYFGPAADVWSLGVVLYQMIEGVLPFKTLVESVQGSYARPTWMSEDCCDFISLALTPDFKERPTIETLCRHKWVTRSLA